MTPQSEDSSIDDRRKARRVLFVRSVRLHFDSHGDAIEATTVDISHGGMLVKTASFRNPGTKLDFTIALSEENASIEGSAEVVRVHGGDETKLPSGMGIHFLELRGASAKLLRSVVEGDS